MTTLLANLAGNNFRPQSAQDALKSARTGADLELEADPTNPHDANAIKVLLDGEHIGFVGREPNIRGIVGNRVFLLHRDFWNSATLARNVDTGQWRVKIESPDE